MSKTKVCTKCGVRKKRTNEFFEKGDSRDGLHEQCKKCRGKYYAKYFKKQYKDPLLREKWKEKSRRANTKYRLKLKTNKTI